MNKIACLTLALLVFCCAAHAQYDDDPPRSVNDGTLVGIGAYNVKDTYLSPLKYTGWGIRIMNERLKKIPLFDNRGSRQQIIHVEMSFSDNPAKTASYLSGFVDYSLGYHYRLDPLPHLRVLAGVSGQIGMGFVYNTRNGNNPASAKADIGLNLSAVFLYNLRIMSYPITLRYQVETPFAGVMFAPHYEQSYYEIFTLGNYKGVVPFTSFHNKFALKNYLTADLPVYNFTLRLGYLNDSFRTNVHHLKSHVISHSFMIGIVKEFVSWGGRKLKNKNKYNSAYY